MLLRESAFPLYRFSDKAAVCCTAELRLIPVWNPVGDIGWFRFFEIDWWQFIPFWNQSASASLSIVVWCGA